MKFRDKGIPFGDKGITFGDEGKTFGERDSELMLQEMGLRFCVKGLGSRIEGQRYRV